ncbi:hypothetical protein C9413_07825 [Rhizobium sp. SEMIA 4085]|uniref:Uncharacterized protein n=1 Tax=Rhizobium gallicum bv. gallicum R602sp TaxID=1041138 RepID=A0A0B4XAY9_9HYPH|nr:MULTISPECIES: hypothetical protein [Rhizobium]AJD43712.1 hypothetical protein RGR602_PB00174 [Rhizobium gallicum bv. gallicum R602sp]NNH29411.1 hypothetical protein [Rhizobium sp. SEMIA 4085]TDW34194.1 hypothetical protein EV128_104201 [Rhizobium azibense]
MKTQQRKFVVELKSTRRRSTMRPASIWANTDLKAHVREAEAEAPHLFEPNMVSKVPGQDSELATDPRPETHLSDNTEAGDEKQISASLVAPEHADTPRQDNDLAFSSIPQLKEGSSGRRSPRPARRRREADGNRHADGAKSVRSMRSTAAQVEAASDELVALDEENRRLRGLLTKHLLQQNIQLHQMLARFGVIET